MLIFVILLFCGGHYAPRIKTFTISKSEFFWHELFKDVLKYCSSSEKCQATFNIKKNDRIPL